MSSHKSNNASIWLYGKHACLAALQNPARNCHEILVLEQTETSFLNQLPKNIPTRAVTKSFLESKIPTHAVHQGVAIRTTPLPFLSLEDLPENGPLVILDQVTDPQNIGAILRSCAAFDAKALIVTKNHYPQESGALAKAASGALELVPIIQVTNLVQTLAHLKKLNFWCYGLDSHTQQMIYQTNFDPKTVFIFGSEGKGLRDLTTKHCDLLVKLPIHPQMESLNVSNAVAATLYEYYRGQVIKPTKQT